MHTLIQNNVIRNIKYDLLASKSVVRLRRLLYEKTEHYFNNYLLKKTFIKRNGYKLNLDNPRTFKEKVCWKMINDRNPLLPIVADKFMVYYYVAAKTGSARADKLFIKNYQYISNTEDFCFSKLPESFILKANFGSGKNLICHDKSIYSESDLKKIIDKWFKSYADQLGPQWAYKNINKMVMIQELKKGDESKPILEFKLYMIHGKCYLIHFISDRFGRRRRLFLDANYMELPDQESSLNPHDVEELKRHREEINDISKKLSVEFDFIRVNFMVHDSILYFGELTNYPGSAFSEYLPKSSDKIMGNAWNVDKNYWKSVK